MLLYQSVGYLLANRAGDQLMFATDTYFIRYKIPVFTHIMIECNYSLILFSVLY